MVQRPEGVASSEINDSGAGPSPTAEADNNEAHCTDCSTAALQHCTHHSHTRTRSSELEWEWEIGNRE